MHLKTVLAALCLLPAMALANSLVNINTADSETLVDSLDGVGPQKAMAIVRYRQANGPFQSVDELLQVKGIGQSTLEQNRANLTVGEQAARR
ncbi:MAG TPA: helix-hairpin-helix domain-containing protein [Gammaproteobacteria bacterium]|nr:helix-hairpin-helix domain-containing protein [Gammaproteobacteria bacterium]